MRTLKEIFWVSAMTLLVLGGIAVIYAASQCLPAYEAIIASIITVLDIGAALVAMMYYLVMTT